MLAASGSDGCARAPFTAEAHHMLVLIGISPLQHRQAKKTSGATSQRAAAPPYRRHHDAVASIQQAMRRWCRRYAGAAAQHAGGACTRGGRATRYNLLPISPGRGDRLAHCVIIRDAGRCQHRMATQGHPLGSRSWLTAVLHAAALVSLERLYRCCERHVFVTASAM